MPLVTRVRVRSAPETEAAGVAGLTGLLCGETRPSSSGVDVVGTAPDDFALAVMFDDGREPLWFRPELLEVIGEKRVNIEFGRPDSRRAARLPNYIRHLLDRMWPEK